LASGKPTKEADGMETLKQEAINVISKMPDSADIDDIMYRLYVIDKVRKGREAVQQGDTMSTEELQREIESW
jgi:hypothetical protein